MNDVTVRLLEYYNYLLNTGRVSGGKDFAQKIGISTSLFTEISKGRTNAGLSAIQKTALHFPINPQWLLLGIGPMEKTTANNNDQASTATNDKSKKSKLSPSSPQILSPSLSPTLNLGLPKVISINERQEELITIVGSKASAGYLNGYADHEYIERLPTIRLSGFNGGTHRAFEVKGHSMSPTIHNSALAVGRWEESLNDIKDRRIYIIVSKTEGIVIKRVLNRIQSSNRLILLSDNQNKREYPNYTIEPEDILEIWYLRTAFIYEFPEPGELYNRFNDVEAKLTIIEEELKRMKRNSF